MSLVEFEEWFDDEYSNYGKSYKERYDERNDMYSSKFVDERYDAFKAGQQSQQDKIDEVNEKHSEEKRILQNVIEMNQAKIDELQKRIDDASNKIDFWVGGKNGDAIHVAKSIGNILKGNKDEN